MPRSRHPTTVVPSPGPPALARPRSEVAAQLKGRIERGNEILNRQINTRSEMQTSSTDLIKWRDYNFDLLKQLFTNETIYKEYRSASFPSRGAYNEVEAFRTQLETATRQVSKLESITERLGLYAEPMTEDAAPATTGVEVALMLDSSKVFVVHGHDEGALQALARFLGRIGLEAIVLRERADQGRTIVEKFEACASEVGFAVALLTPDDLGGPVAASEQAARARQNVIFELGYFVGRLGRGRACLLRKDDIEIPSDLVGIIYTDFDHPAEGWKVKLARELKAAGFKFEADKVLA